MAAITGAQLGSQLDALDRRWDRATDEQRARWVTRAEYCRAHPEYTELVRAHDPGRYRQLMSGLIIVGHRAETAPWRDPVHGGRAEQLLPGTAGSFSSEADWRIFLALGGRGGGKSRLGSEGTTELLYGTTWTADPRGAFVGRTLDAVRVEMFLNGILRVVPPRYVRRWVSTTCDLELAVPGGRTAHLKGYSATSPDRLRGPNFHFAWVDEFAAFGDANSAPAATGTTLSNLNLGVRARHRDPKGRLWRPRIIVTTTPRPVRGLRNPDPDDPMHPGLGLADSPLTVVTNIPTTHNLANLAPEFYASAIAPLEGTRLFQQEVMGELVDAHPGALWSHELVAAKMQAKRSLINTTELVDTIIAVDPTVGSGMVSSDECGIMVMGRDGAGIVYVIADLTVRAHPGTWSKIVARAYREYGASVIVAERNQGGFLISETLANIDPSIQVELVWATENKIRRAEPVAVLCEQDRVRLIGAFPELVYQLTTVDGADKSAADDRLDAFVWGATYLADTALVSTGVFTVPRLPAAR